MDMIRQHHSRAASAPCKGGRLRSGELLVQCAHARQHLPRHSIIAQDMLHVSQAAGLTLDNEMPERHAGASYQDRPQVSLLCRGRNARPSKVVLVQSSKRPLERMPQPAERRRLLLRKLVLQEVQGRGSGRSSGHGLRFNTGSKLDEARAPGVSQGQARTWYLFNQAVISFQASSAASLR